MVNRIDILINARKQTTAIDQVGNELRSLDQAAATLNSGLSGLGAAVGIGAVVAGIQQIGSAIDDLARRGAIFQQLQDVQSDFAASVGETANAFVESGRTAAQGTIADFDLILNANRAIQFQVASTAEDYAKLIELATALGRAQGVSDTQALDFITRGIARRSSLILDNLGLFIDIEQAEAEYAESLGKTASALSVAERNQAILNEAFRQGQTAIEANRDAFDSAATKFERADAALQNAKDTLGELFAPSIATAAENISDAVGDLVDAILYLQQIGFLPEIDEKPVNAWLNLTEASNAYLETRQQIAELEARGIGGQRNGTFQATQAVDALAQAEDRAKQEALALEDALADVPVRLQELVRTRIDLDFSSVSTSELTRRVAEYENEFETLEKLQTTTKQRLIANAVKASDIIGDTRAFDLAEQQIVELQDRIDQLGVRLFSGEINEDEFLFELAKLPGAVTEIFDDINQAGADGANRLRERLTGLLDLRGALEVSGNTAAIATLDAQIQQLESTLAIIDPAVDEVGSSLEYLIPAASGARVALSDTANDAARTAAEINALTGSLDGAPAGLINLANAAIAAGVPLDEVAAKVANLRDEFNALAGVQAGVRRSIFNAAAGVVDIVGDTKAFSIAQEQIAGLDSAVADLDRQLFNHTITVDEYDFRVAQLQGTYTQVFDDIRNADAEAQRLTNTVGGGLTKAFDGLQSKVAGVLSGALNVNVGVDTSSILPREDEINEDARRLADVAVRGWDSPWASYLAQKFPGLIGEAFEGGGDVKQTAARILRDFEDGLVPQLLDKETAKERVRRALIGEQNMADLAREVAAELSAEFGGQFSVGQIQATAGVTLGVAGAETEQIASTIAGAGAGITEKLSGVGDSIRTGIVSALDGVGEAITNALSTQLRSEGNLKAIKQSGYDNGLTWGDGFLDSMDELTGQVLEKLASLVAPYVEAQQTQTATLQGAN